MCIFLYSLLMPILVVLPLHAKEKLPPITLTTLNSYYLEPVSFPLYPPAVTTIAQLFQKCQQTGFIPVQGLITYPHGTQPFFWAFHQGIPHHRAQPLVIHSSPRADTWGRFWYGEKGYGLRCVNPWIKNQIITCPVITFDYFYGSAGFDFGQGINVTCLDRVCTEVHAQNPEAPLIIAGTCVGAKITLELVARKSIPNLHALILESPFTNVRTLVKNIEKKYGSWLPFDLGDFFAWYFQDSKKVLIKPHTPLSAIPATLPIFIAHLDNDAYYTNREMQSLIDELKASGNKDMYLLVIKDPSLTHGHLNNKKVFAQAVSAFLATYTVPHDEEQAHQGKSILETCKENVALHHTEWHKYS